MEEVAGLRSLRAVTLDFWFTLFADRPGTDDLRRQLRLDGLAAALGAYGYAFPEATLLLADADARLEHMRWQADGLDKPVTEQVVFLLNRLRRGLAGELGPTAVEALVARYGAATMIVRPLPLAADLQGVLAALRDRNLRIGLVSNTGRTSGMLLRQLLRDAGILPFFAVLSFSDELGLAKPGAPIFARTLAALGVPAAAAVHVGDDQRLDVLGACNAGMASVLVRASPPDASAAPPNRWITSLADLPAALDALDALDAAQARP